MMIPETRYYLLVALGYALIMFLEWCGYVRQSRSLEDILDGKGDPGFFLYKEATGALILWAILLASGFVPRDPLCQLPDTRNSVWIFVFVFMSLLVTSLAWLGFQRYKQEFHWQEDTWLPASSFVAWHMILRIVFLVGYEFFFRGIMLSIMAATAGFIQVIIFNTSLYAIAHVFGKPRDIIGTIPLGVLFCLLTRELNSVWPAVIIHLLLAIPYETSMIHFIRSNRKTINA